MFYDKVQTRTMQILTVLGFVLLYSASATCALTKPQVISCVKQSGAVDLVLELDLMKLKEQGSHVLSCMGGCLMREAGYINASNKLDEDKIINDYVKVLDPDIFNVNKIKETDIACIRHANQGTNDCDIMQLYMMCEMQNVYKLLEGKSKV